MKKKILFLALLFAAMACRAEQALVVYTTEGLVAMFVVEGEPRITATADEVTVTAGPESISYAISELDRFALEDVILTGIATETLPSPVFRIGGDGLRCEGLMVGERVQVYDLGGRLVRQGVANGDGRISLPMTRGTYVVKAGKKTFKTTKQ